MTEITQKYRKARMGVALMGNARMGLIPVVRDQDEAVLRYGHKRVQVDETGLGFTEVE